MRNYKQRLNFTHTASLALATIIVFLGGTLFPASVYAGESACKDTQALLGLDDSFTVNCADDAKDDAPKADSDAKTILLPFGHSHNDYYQKRPLLDALDHGFGSVEADIFLVDGKLMVAHHPKEIKPERTLEALYLDPLLKRVRANGGSVYTNGQPLILLIDLKTDAESTYRVLLEVLEPYRELFTVFHKDRTETKAVTVIITGRIRPRKFMESEEVRIAGYEGTVSELELSDSPHFMPLISDNWRSHFKWNGKGPMPDEERTKLKEIVAKTHQQGKIIRFWGAPNHPDIWTELLNADVDLINVDPLAKFKEFCLTNNIRN